jgi:hypothetical protein
MRNNLIKRKHLKHKPFFNACGGSNMAEYVLPLALFGLALITVVPQGAALRQWFQNWVGATMGGQVQGTTIVIQGN